MKKLTILCGICSLFLGCTDKIQYNPVVTPAVETYEPINVTASTAELVGHSPDGGGQIIDRGFYYIADDPVFYDESGELNSKALDSLLLINGTAVAAPVEGDFSVTIRDLSSDAYLFTKAYVKNAAGLAYGEALGFRTSTMVTPTVIIDKTYEEVSSDAVVVRGEVTKVGGSLATERGFVWGQNADPDDYEHREVIGANQGEFSHTISSLELFVKYYVFSFATNAVGTSYSDPLVVMFVPPTFTDSRDGEVYTVKQYDGDIWITQNFRYLPAVGNAAGIWVQDYTGDNVEEAKSTANYQKYGALYTLQQAIDLAPEGWHLATDEEWKRLEMVSSNGSLTAEGADMLEWRPANASRLKAWDGASNDLQFNLLPGGKQWCGGAFQELAVWSHYWAAKEGHPYDSAFRRMLAGWDNNIFRQDTQIDGYPVCVGMSVRYVKD